MRRLWAGLLFVILLASCGGGNKNAFITGKLKGTKAKIIYFEEVTQNGYRTIDSAKISESGEFAIQKKAGKHGYYMLRIGKMRPSGFSDLPTNVIMLITDSSETIKIEAEGPDFRINYRIEGSEETRLMQQLANYIKTSSAKLDSLNPVVASQRGMSQEAIEQEMKKASEERTAYAKEFIKSNSDKIVSIQALALLNLENEFETANNLVESLQAKYPEDPYIFNLRTQLAYMAPFVIGAMAPDFTVQTPQGGNISLSDFRGKYVLIDFWASWCGPCRQVNPELVRVYNKYKGQNFEIFGVSLDAKKEQWTDAIEQDGLAWKHGSDLGYWNAAPAKIYNVTSIPYSVMVDPEGKIFAKNLDPFMLDELLKQVFNSGS